MTDGTPQGGGDRATPAVPHRVLVTTGNRLSDTVAARVLQEAGCEVATVTTGDCPLGALRDGGHDVLVAGTGPSAQDAVGLVRALRADEALRATPVIVLSGGLDARAEGLRLLDEGAHDYVTMPFEPAELRARVQAALRMVALERERAAALTELLAREGALRELAMEQGALRRVAAAVAAGRAPEDVFALVAEEVAALLGTEGGGVARFEDDSAYLVGAFSRDPALRSEVGMEVRLDGDGVTAKVRATGRPARIDDYQASGRQLDGTRSWRGRRSSVAAPVTVAGLMWGTVGAVSMRRQGLPVGSERRLARFAELVALAIGNATSQARIRELALRDHLTGVFNRRAFEEHLAEQIARSHHQHAPLSLLMMDVDHFKNINDSHGHQQGDRVLVEVARRLRSATRQQEMAARIGGEEFAVVLPDASAGGAALAGERLRHLIEEHRFPGVGRVTVSVGVAELVGTEDLDDLYRNADAALYRAKLNGRNRVVVWEHPEL